MMFSIRWQLLKTTIESGMFMTPDRQISYAQFLLLFEAFLLQIKDAKGMVYIVASKENSPLATHFVETLITSLNLSACKLSSAYKNVTFHLALLQKIDLLITLDPLEYSTNTLTAAKIAKIKDIPLISLGGGQNHSMTTQGDLNAYFKTTDKTLIQTGQFLLLKEIIDAWPYNTHSSILEKNPLLPQTQLHPLPTRLRI